MIQGFGNIIQQDISLLYHHLRPAKDVKTAQPIEKVQRAAVRMFAVLGMVFSVAVAAGAFTAGTVLGAFIKLAVAITLYVICHDVFIISWNKDKPANAKVKDFLGNLMHTIQDPANNNKKIGSAHYATHDTLLRPIWDSVLPQ